MKMLSLLKSGLFGIVLLWSVEQGLSQTTCDDAYECEGDSISTTYVYCYGYFGCDEATISASYTYAYGAYAAYLAELSSTYIYNYGFRATYYATISTYAMYGYGYLAFQYADVEPSSSTLYLYAYGRYAGYYSDVYCYSGDKCYIYCGTAYGCYYMDFYCYSGATCYYNCNSDEVCPTLYSGVGSQVSTNTMELIKSGSTNGLTVGSRTDMTDDEINEQRKRKAALKKAKVEAETKSGLMDEETVRQEMELSMNKVFSGINGINSSKSSNLWDIEEMFGFWPSMIVAALIGGSVFELLRRCVCKGNLKRISGDYQPISAYQAVNSA